MKVIFSRKGFDSQYGGIPSPIFPDGRILPLPIPSDYDAFRLKDLYSPDIEVSKVVSDLSRGRIKATARVHHDPDLARSSVGRARGWRPSFGQCGSALRHLQKSGVDAGDVFLFFGWFKQIECRRGSWIYKKGAQDIHLIFGWLEVAEFVDLTVPGSDLLTRQPWVIDHPHVSADRYNKVPGGNGLFIGAETSRLARKAEHGGGRFSSYDSSLRLTDHKALNRSIWSLPGWFHPTGSRRPPQLSYHMSTDRWTRRSGRAIVQTVAKGQEFVFCSTVYPDATGWLRDLVRKNAKSAQTLDSESDRKQLHGTEQL
jgi:hypothetical protein